MTWKRTQTNGQTNKQTDRQTCRPLPTAHAGGNNFEQKNLK